MSPGYPGNTTRAAQARGIIQPVHSVLAVCFFKGTSTTKPDKQARMDGVSTYLALTFGTLLSSQGTELPSALIRSPEPAPPGFPFVVSPTLADSPRSDEIRAARLVNQGDYPGPETRKRLQASTWKSQCR
jgi:hypothetical protein